MWINLWTAVPNFPFFCNCVCCAKAWSRLIHLLAGAMTVDAVKKSLQVVDASAHLFWSNGNSWYERHEVRVRTSASITL